MGKSKHTTSWITETQSHFTFSETGVTLPPGV